MTKQQCQAIANAMVACQLSQRPLHPEVQAIVDECVAEYVNGLIYGFPRMTEND